MFPRDGIDGALATRTSISLVKAAEGRLCYRGYSIGDLARDTRFEEVIYLLWFGDLPTRKALASFSAQLRAERNPPRAALDIIRSAGADCDPMDSLSIAVSTMAASDPDRGDNAAAANLRKGLRVITAMPALTAYHSRMRRKLDPIAPDPELGHAENLLYMIVGERPDSAKINAINAVMTLQAEHGIDPSAFAARVTASTHADLHAALTSAIGTLKGPLDGGAIRAVLEMLLAIANKSKAREVIDNLLRAKKKIPGFGHRTYKDVDPRAIEFKNICERLSTAAGDRHAFELAIHVQEIVHKRTGLSPNAYFYCAPACQMLGLAAEDFAPIAACAHAAGWIAHVAEQHSDNRPIRLHEEYIGLLARAFVPLDERV